MWTITSIKYYGDMVVSPYAWVSPKGDYYPVNFAGHGKKADQLVIQLYPQEVDNYKDTFKYIVGEIILEDKGWVRITDRGYFSTQTPTREQWDVITQHHITWGKKWTPALKRFYDRWS